MDRRTSERLQATRPVLIKLLGDTDQEVEANLEDLSEGGAALACRGRVPVGTPIRLDLEDSLFLGEVIYCAEEEGRFRVGLRFQQCLGRMSDLKKLVGALVGASRPAKPKASCPTQPAA